MQVSDREEFVAILNGMAAIKNKSLTKEAISLWWNAMQAWSLDDFRAAASHLVNTCQFMPSPYDFAKIKRDAAPTAGEAWDLVLTFCRNSCRGDAPGGRIDRAARAVGGYSMIGHANSETQLPFIERNFKEAYEELSEVEDTRQVLPQITMAQLQRIAGEKEQKRLQNKSVCVETVN